MDIMTINIQKIHEKPLKVNSEIYSAFNTSVLDLEQIEGYLWYGTKGAREHIWDVCLEEFIKCVNNYKNLKAWLLIGDTFWQKDSPLTRKKLQKSVLPSEYDLEAHTEILNIDSKIKRISAFDLTLLDSYRISEEIVNGYNVMLLALDKERTPSQFPQYCWDFKIHNGEKIIKNILDEKGVIANFFGQFDDAESGIMAFFPVAPSTDG